eukprot:scaffold168_cov124-Cylindrotheca_fusiformis.AAC.12
MKTILLLALATNCVAFNRFVGYEPATVVIDESKIDLDQKELEAQLSLGTNTGYDAAIKIYTEGAHCGSYANLEVEPLHASLNVGDEVSGKAQDGSTIAATVMKNYPQGKEEIQVLYRVDTDTSSFADSGTLTIDDDDPDLNFTYSVSSGTKNWITLQTLSTSKRQDVKQWCPQCNSDDFNKFFRLYGEHDYADKWFTAARQGEKTNFFFGDADFGKYGLVGKVQAMTTATLVLHIWMHVIWLMEDAVGTCNSQLFKSPVISWDRAVAFYTGSLEGEDSGSGGFLLNDLSNRLCQRFKTCGSDGRDLIGESFANYQILNSFKDGLDALKEDDCSAAESRRRDIARWMLVPLVQGLLLNGYSQHVSTNGDEGAETAGATFAASVLPYVYDCNPEDAITIWTLMGARPDRTGTDFPRVKEVLERNYECMGLKCADIGGIWDSDNDAYYPHAGVCKDGLRNKDRMFLGIGLSVFGALMLLCIVLCTYRRNGDQTEDLQTDHETKLEDVSLDDQGEEDELPELS